MLSNMQDTDPDDIRQKLEQAHGASQVAEKTPVMLRRYESEEEEISEAETSTQDRVYSPIEGDSDTGAFDSELSADEQGYESAQAEQENDHYRNMLSPYLPVCKRSRPVSMDTVKRSSCATFVPNSFYHDDDEVISPSTPLTTSPLPSPVLLEATGLVPPEASEYDVNLYHQSSYLDHMSSDDEVDVESPLLVATPVIYMIPRGRPNLISIRPSSARSTPMKQESISGLSRRPSRSTRSNGSVRSNTRPRLRKNHKRQSSSLSSFRSSYSTELFNAPSYPPPVGTPLCPDGDATPQLGPPVTSPPQVGNYTGPLSSGYRLRSVHSRHQSRSRSRSRVGERVLAEPPALQLSVGDTAVEPTETSATITSLSEIPPIPYSMSPRSMSLSFPLPLTSTSNRESMCIGPHFPRPATSMGRSPSIRSTASSNSVDITPKRRSKTYLLLEDNQSIKPMPHYQRMYFQRKMTRQSMRPGSMSFRPHSRLQSSEPLPTASPVPYYSSPNFSRHRPESTYGENTGGHGIHHPNATYPYARDSGLFYSALGIRSSSTSDLTIEDIPVSEYDDNTTLKPSRNTSQKRARDNGDSPVRGAGRGFMGFRLGRKKRAATPTDED